MALEIEVQPATSNGLEVIRHLPAIRPCRLEGRNGIGKSTLVRLLSLASGDQPYGADERAWRSLKASLGTTSLTIRGLAGAFGEALLTFTPDAWPELPQTDVGEWLGTLEVEGQLIPLGDLFASLTVIHLSGTEGLHHTLSQKYPQMANALQEVSESLDQLDDARAALGELVELLEDLSPSRAEAEATRERAATGRRRELESALRRVRIVVDDLGQASAYQAILSSGDAQEHEDRTKRLRLELSTARGELATAERAHDQALAALAKGNSAQREAAKLERKHQALSRERDELLNKQLEFAPVLESLGFDFDSTSLSAAQQVALDERRSDLEQQVRTLRQHMARARRSLGENELFDDLRAVLDQAVESGYGELVLAEIEGLVLTVETLLRDLGHVTLPLNEADDSALEQTAHLLGRLNEVESVLQRRAEIGTELKTVETELEAARKTLPEQDALDEIVKETRVSLDFQMALVRSLNTQIGALSRSGLGTTDIEQARNTVAELLTRHGVELDELAARLGEARVELAGYELEDSQLANELAAGRSRAAQRRVKRESLRRRARVEPGLRWILAIAERDRNGDTYDDLGEWPDEVWEQLLEFGSEARRSLNALTNDLRGLAAVAATAGQHGRLASAVKAVIEIEAKVELSTPAIAEALFDGGEVQRVNMDDQSISWVTPDGQLRSRPLTTFSSGQQALGYIRARLHQIADEPSQNRMVFLDEFGAFIAADRRRPLAELLTGSDLTSLARDVIVVLPLQADYEAELSQTMGGLHDTFERRAAAIRRDGYFTEEFVG